MSQLITSSIKKFAISGVRTIIVMVGVGIWISGIGFTHIRPDIHRVLDAQYPIIWDWV